MTEAGVGCSVMVAPILPGPGDAPERQAETVAALVAGGAESHASGGAGDQLALS